MRTQNKNEILQALLKLGFSDDEIFIDPDHLQIEARATLLWPPDSEVQVVAIIKPKSHQGVQSLVRLANEMEFPLWTVSRGRNWGYGSMRPLCSGCVILSLENLNQIIEVNEELAYAVIEPGVTYRQLRSFLDEKYPNLWSDCTDGPPEGSVIGNALDRGLGVTSLGDHFASLCGFEVLLADGSLIKTGGGPPNCSTWNTHKWGVGPYLEGIFTQSNFGIVMKAGVWLLRRPKRFESFVFDLKNPNDIGKMVDQIRELFLAGVLTSFTHIVNDITTLAVLSKFPRQKLNQLNQRTDHILKALKEELGVPCWSFGGGLQGDQEQVRYMKKKLKSSLKGLGQLDFVNDNLIQFLAHVEQGLQSKHFLRKWLSVVLLQILKLKGLTLDKIEAAPYIHSVLKGIPSDYFVRHAYLKSKLPKPEIAHPEKDEIGLIWFAPILPMTGEHLNRVLEVNKKLFIRSGFEFYAALLVQNARSMICLHGIFFNPSLKKEVLAAQKLYLDLQKSMYDLGYQEYRVPLIGMPQLFKTDKAYSQILSQIKSCLDPKGILSPQKYGIRGETGPGTF